MQKIMYACFNNKKFMYKQLTKYMHVMTFVVPSPLFDLFDFCQIKYWKYTASILVTMENSIS
jgi:hypothetical protein